MKILCKQPDGSVQIVIGAAKSDIEDTLGRRISDNVYEQMVLATIPADTVSSRIITDADIPNSREFRDAWEDALPGSRVDINLAKVKALKLAELRQRRNAALLPLDRLYMQALEANDSVALADIANKRQQLRDATAPLIALNVSGYNDPAVIDQIKQAATLPNPNGDLPLSPKKEE